MEMSSVNNLNNPFDSDAQGTEEWLAALQATMQTSGPERARYLLSR